MDQVTFGKRVDDLETANIEILFNDQVVGYIETRRTTNHYLSCGMYPLPRNPYIWNENQWFVDSYAVLLDDCEDVIFEVGFDDNARSILAQAKRFAKTKALKLAEIKETAVKGLGTNQGNQKIIHP